MADEDITRQFIDALNDYNRVIKDAVTEQQKVNQELVKSEKRLEQLNAAYFQGAISEKEYRQEREKSNKSAIDSARYYARAQMEAEKQTKTLGYQFVKMAGSSISNQRALLRMEQGLKTAGAVIGQLASGATSFASGLAQGDTKFTSLNPLIDGVAGAMSKLVEGIPYVGGLLSGAMKLAAEGAKFMNQQLQTAVDTFQEFSAVGALTTRGMSGVQEQFLRSGLSLESFRKQITANAATLATFRGSVGSGAEDFSKIVGAVVDGSGDELRRLGFSAEAMGEATAGYVKRQASLGLAQTKTNAQLTRGAVEYAKELDTLAKLTGNSRKALEEQQEAARNEGRFRAQLDDMIDAGREKEARALENFSSIVAADAPQLAQGLRDMSTGLTNSQAAIKLYNSTGGAAQGIIERLKRGEIDEVQASKEMQAAIKANIQTQRQYAKAAGDGNEVFADLAQTSKFANKEIKDLASIQADAANQMAKGTDPLTDSATGAQKGLEQMSREINNLSFQILPKYAKVMESTTDVMNKGIRKMSEGLGIPSPVLQSTGGKAPGAAPAAGGKAPGAAGAGSAATSRRDLVDQGLRIKAGDVQAEGSGVSPKLIALAKRIQSEVPGFQYFSGFNDRFHQEKSPSSTHTKGLAADFAVAPTPSAEQGRIIANQLKAMGFAEVLDEYNNPSAKATAGHFHAAISAQNGFQGLISGPKSGYRPNIVMHGEEELSIKPKPTGGSMDMMDRLGNSMGEQMDMMGAQLSALENLVSAMRDQNSISAKILQATNN